MRINSIAGLFLLFVIAWPLKDSCADEPLFNGKDLSGWVLVNTPPQNLDGPRRNARLYGQADR